MSPRALQEGRVTDKPRKPVAIGTIWYHPLSPDCPFIVRDIENGYTYSDRGDGARGFQHSLKWVEEQEHLEHLSVSMNTDKPRTLQSAIAKANAVIRNIRLNGWMKPWATYINGERVEAVSKEDCARHRELRGREK